MFNKPGHTTSRTSWIAGLASLLLHGILVVMLGLNLSHLANERPLSPAEIELVQQTDRQDTPHKNHSGLKKTKSTEVLVNGFTRQQTEDIFFPKTNYTDVSEQVAQNTAQEKLAQAEENSVQGRLRRSGLNQVFGEDGNRNWAHNQEVYTRIDSHLQFDSLLAQYNHFGAVLVQFNLDDHGLLLLNSLKVKAADPILKVHVLRAMQAGLSEPMNETKGHRDQLNPVYQAQFNFKKGSSENNFVRQNSFGRPAFLFERTTEERPVADSLGGQLADLSLLGNPLLMAEKIEKYNRKKRRDNLKFDPFDNYRHDPFYQL